VHGGDVLVRLFDRGVGQQAAIDAGRGGVARQALQAVAEHRVQIGEQQERRFRTLADFARDREHTRERGAGLQGALARALDHRTIGDGIGKRHAQLDQVRAAAQQRLDQRRRALRRGIARRDVGDETLAPGANPIFEHATDARHGWSISGKFSR
jgi:hypothetical protein